MKSRLRPPVAHVRAACAWTLTAVLAGTFLPAAIPAHAAPSTTTRPLDRLVYTSTRDGQVDIWSANSDGSDQVRLTTDPAHDTHPDVSADGTKIAFIRGEGVLKGSTPTYAHLWVMDADGGNARQIFDEPLVTDYRPDFSPDGGRILFSRFSDVVGAVPELWSVNSDGTNATRWATNANYGSWAPDGTRIAHNRLNLPEVQIWATEGDGSTTQLTFEGRTNVAPQWSPDGTRIVFTSFRNGRGEVWVMDADGTDQHRVVGSAGKDGLATWSPDSERIAFASTRHTACPPDLTELCPHRIYTVAADGSDLRPFADNALSDMYPTYAPQPVVAQDAPGQIVYAGNRGGTWDLFVANADGSGERRLTTSPFDDVSPDVSPDGDLVVFARGASLIPQGPSLDLWVAKLDGSGEWPLLDDPVNDDYMPKWSPDGTRVAFTRHPNPAGGLFVNDDQVFVVDVTTREVRQLTSEGTFNGFPDWSPDGTLIAFNSTRAGGSSPLASGIYVMSALDGSGQQRISPPESFDYNPAWSGDGAWLALRSGLVGSENQIWKMRPDGTERTPLTSDAHWNGFPDWSGDDRQIAFHSTDGDCPGNLWTVCSQIWRIGANGESPKALTSGPVGNLYVRYVPEPA